MSQLNASVPHPSESEAVQIKPGSAPLQPGTDSSKNSNKRNAKPLIVMLVLFSLPYFISWYYMYSDDPIIKVSSNNKGLLVSPMKALDDISFVSKTAIYQSTEIAEETETEIKTTISETDSNTTQWLGKWTMVTVIDGSCQEVCQKTLYHMGQVRKAMAVNRDKVHRVAIVTAMQDSARLDDILVDYSGTEFIVSPRPSIDRLLSQLSGVTETLTHGVYLIDPRGNFMMAYSADMPPKFLLDDMERLFKVNK